MKNTEYIRKVQMDEIGLFLRTIEAEYNPKDNQEMANLITQFFNVICTEEDIEHYEALYQEDISNRNMLIETDWELESRKAQYFSSINRINPYY
jgi:hypothetical protein